MKAVIELLERMIAEERVTEAEALAREGVSMSGRYSAALIWNARASALSNALEAVEALSQQDEAA
jgi:hypothetical protein